jgi:hypothetical protein
MNFKKNSLEEGDAEVRELQSKEEAKSQFLGGNGHQKEKGICKQYRRVKETRVSTLTTDMRKGANL